MKFNIDKPPSHVRRQNKINDKLEWHTKFAWLPTTVDETEDSYKKVLFENYWRKGHWGPSRMGQLSSMRFTKYSEKEYFKKKLNGDFDKEEFEADVDRNVGAVSSASLSSNKILKKGGPRTTNPYKRNTV